MEFTLRFKKSLSYEEIVDVDVRFKRMPNEKDRKDLLDAIETIKNISETYIGADAKKAVESK